MAGISVVSTYFLYSALRCAGNSTGSVGLLAGAQQNLADTLTSAGVLINVPLAQLGPALFWCDSLGMGIVGLVIMKDAGMSWWSDIRMVMDASLSRKRLRQIRAIVGGVDGVMEASFVKVRRTGQGVRVDLGLLIPLERSISRAQQISTDAREAVLRRLNWVKDIDIYVYPAKSTFSRSKRDVAGAEEMESLGRLPHRGRVSRAP